MKNPPSIELQKGKNHKRKDKMAEINSVIVKKVLKLFFMLSPEIKTSFEFW